MSLTPLIEQIINCNDPPHPCGAAPPLAKLERGLRGEVSRYHQLKITLHFHNATLPTRRPRRRTDGNRLGTLAHAGRGRTILGKTLFQNDADNASRPRMS